MKKFLLGLLCVFCVLSLHAQTNLSAEVEKLLPVGKCNVDIMGVVYPRRFLELGEKLQNAFATNKDWLLDYIKKNAKEGEPLPYSPKFGLTKKEYEEYLSLGEKRTLGKIGSGTLLVKTNLSGFEFDGGSELIALTGIKINLKELTIVTPFAILKNPTREGSSGGPALGAYSGYQWNFEQGDLEKGDVTVASFLIGKRKESGRFFIYYKGGVMQANNSISDVRVVIYYDKN
ncbi:MAG: hypothetical protein NTZ16_02365 [Verrucomicrobia bacterium]|nr:hypothetical protein [Verrucomicrobiota bacterium]